MVWDCVRTGFVEMCKENMGELWVAAREGNCNCCDGESRVRVKHDLSFPFSYNSLRNEVFCKRHCISTDSCSFLEHAMELVGHSLHLETGGQQLAF